MLSVLNRQERCIATGLVTKHRFFIWLQTKGVIPDTRVVILSRNDDTTFGILSSSFHNSWTLATCQYHGVGNDPVYTAGTCFETFPFPEGLTPNIPAADYADDPRAIAVAAAAKELNEKREAWLNPSDLVDRVPEVVPGYPDRLIPKHEEAAKILKTRTLTKLYNERPTWLANLHERLDAAVAAAYGWPADITVEDALERLLGLNLERAAAGR